MKRFLIWVMILAPMVPAVRGAGMKSTILKTQLFVMLKPHTKYLLMIKRVHKFLLIYILFIQSCVATGQPGNPKQERLPEEIKAEVVGYIIDYISTTASNFSPDDIQSMRDSLNHIKGQQLESDHTLPLESTKLSRGLYELNVQDWAMVNSNSRLPLFFDSTFQRDVNKYLVYYQPDKAQQPIVIISGQAFLDHLPTSLVKRKSTIYHVGLALHLRLYSIGASRPVSFEQAINAFKVESEISTIEYEKHLKTPLKSIYFLEKTDGTEASALAVVDLKEGYVDRVDIIHYEIDLDDRNKFYKVITHLVTPPEEQVGIKVERTKISDQEIVFLRESLLVKTLRPSGR